MQMMKVASDGRAYIGAEIPIASAEHSMHRRDFTRVRFEFSQEYAAAVKDEFDIRLVKDCTSPHAASTAEEYHTWIYERETGKKYTSDKLPYLRCRKYVFGPGPIASRSFAGTVRRLVAASSSQKNDSGGGSADPNAVSSRADPNEPSPDWSPDSDGLK